MTRILYSSDCYGSGPVSLVLCQNITRPSVPKMLPSMPISASPCRMVAKLVHAVCMRAKR